MTRAREEKTIRGLQFRVSKNIVAQLNKCTCTRSVRCNIFILYILVFLPYVKFRAVAVYTYIRALAFSYVIALSMAFLVDRWWDMLANRCFSLRYEKSRNRTYLLRENNGLKPTSGIFLSNSGLPMGSDIVIK